MKKKRSTYRVLVLPEKPNLEPTRKNDLALDRLDTKAKLGAEERVALPPPIQRVEPMTPEEFQKWKRMNWLRCRCECDDLFDMCLNCITHRQANDLVN